MKRLNDSQRNLVYIMSTHVNVEKMNLNNTQKHNLWKHHDKCLEGGEFSTIDLKMLNWFRRLYIDKVLRKWE